MELNLEKLVLEAFHRAAPRVPAYRTLLSEANVVPSQIRTLEDFEQLPTLDKASTFQRFDISQLCLDGRLGHLGSVLTSSGHSGIFAFGLTAAEDMAHAADALDDLLDHLFSVRSRRTLLINCLPMGVKVPTRSCTLAETSVRPDMVIGLIHEFAHHFAQIILIGDAAFIKLTLELGRRQGIEWPRLTVQVIVGEEILAENARIYLEGILGIDTRTPHSGMVVSSMGIAEVGLNLFAEIPPKGALVALRRALHRDAELRHRWLGPENWVPSIFTYDPRRIYVEFDSAGRLLLTTLDPRTRVPLIRYAPGDRGSFLPLTPELQASPALRGISWSDLANVPVVMIHGRGDHVLASGVAVFPEAVKEGIYHDPSLAALTTANFRLRSDGITARVRIQLAPGIAATADIERRFSDAIALYAGTVPQVSCEPYGSFGNGMALDYERKFPYLEK
jgi:hypothetical protein